MNWNDPGTLALATVELDGSTIISRGARILPHRANLLKQARNWTGILAPLVARTISSGGEEWLIIDFEPDDPLTGSNSIKVTFGGTANCYIESAIP